MISNDLSIYEEFGADWWKDDSHHFRSLRAVNEFRLELISSWIPLKQGDTAVDLGCGGGFIAVPLDHAGVKVIGIDLSPRSLKTAAERCTNSLGFISADVRAVPIADDCADAVIIADVLDHISEYELALRECSRILRPGGRLFLTTLNRSWFSALIAVHIAERIGLIPRGTHDPSMFIKPGEIAAAADRCGLRVENVSGGAPLIFQTIREWTIRLRESKSASIFYAMSLIKDIRI